MRPALTGSLHPLELLADVGVGPPVAKVVKAEGGTGENSGLNEPDADHGAGPALAALAVHHNHVSLVLRQPLPHLGLCFEEEMYLLIF